MRRFPYLLGFITLGIHLGTGSCPQFGLAAELAQIPPLPSVPPLPQAPPLPPVPTLPQVPVTIPPPAPPKRIETELKDFTYWSNLCNLLADSSQYDEAVTACETAIVLRPQDSGIWADYGGVLLSQKKSPDAIAALDQSLNLNNKNSLALTYRCMAFAGLGRDEEALDNCNQALKVNGSWGRKSPTLAWFHRGRLFSRQPDYEQALYSYDQLLLQEPQHSLALTYRCEVLVYLGRAAAAIDSCDRALAINRHWGDQTPALAWINRGFAHRTLQQWSAAIADYDLALNLDPTNAATWAAHGMVLEELAKPQEALISYEQALQLNPKSSLLWVSKCTLLNQLDQYEAAQKACEQALKGDGTWREKGVAQVWNQLAQALTGLGKLEEALAAANRSVGMLPSWGKAWSDRAVVLWYLEQYDEALTSVKKALKLDPDDARAWANQGRILRSLNQPSQALAAYQEALKRDPEDTVTWANQSVVQWMLGDYKAALNSANRALTIDPNLVQGWLNRAVALVALQNYPAALNSYDRAISLSANNAEAWAGLGLVLAQQQKYQDAIPALQTALKLNPNHQAAQQALQALLAEQQRSQKKPR